ncbi:hypothetical protein [Pseudomonas mosselii]|uniref:hypothetical protein n=1 Tax=Pseudomonas mosselii TaxID=78327 RepID=UPI00164694BD|nr:hypothetical protein [Pseudomonas mosselii]MBC3455986.1 hypothetical protein [Pseudomonas mosselii]
MTLYDLAHILEDHFRPKVRDITRFAGTGYSFEEWFNWEQFSAITARKFKCDPKPSYKTHFNGHASAQLGDIVIWAKDGTIWIVETSLVHAYTQNKWRTKIIEDRKKLQGSVGQGVRKVQLILLCSDVETELQSQWAYWFEDMPFWKVPNQKICLNDGEQGEVCLLFWEVE